VAGEEDFSIAPGDLRLVGHGNKDKWLTPIRTDHDAGPEESEGRNDRSGILLALFWARTFLAAKNSGANLWPWRILRRARMKCLTEAPEDRLLRTITSRSGGIP
jgi:hypothetical protein